MALVEAPLATALITPDWSGLSQYPPYNLPDPVINGGGTKTDARPPLIDDSDDTYVELSWAVGAQPSINRGPFTQGGSNDGEYLAGWPARPTTRRGFDSTRFSDGFNSLSYAMSASYAPAGPAVEFGIRIAFFASGPDPYAGRYQSPPAFYLGGIPTTPDTYDQDGTTITRRFEEIRLVGGTSDRVANPAGLIDGVFRDYVFTEDVSTAVLPGPLYLRPAAIELGNDGEDTEYRFTARISRMYLKVVTASIEGSIGPLRSRFNGGR